MRITNLMIKDFQGKNGTFSYSFPDKIAVFSSGNGNGKTSILNAIRFALTGDAEKERAIYKGAAKCDVGITLEDGTKIIRELSTDSLQKCWYNQKPVQKGALDSALEKKLGMPIKVTKIVSASEMLGKMKPQDLSDLMLGYIPERLNAQTLTEYIPDCTEGMKEIVEGYFQEEIFGFKGIEQFYTDMYEARKEQKKIVSELTGAMSALKNAYEPKRTRAEVTDLLNKCQEYLKEKAQYEAAVLAYENAKKQREVQMKELKELEEELKSMPGTEYKKEDLEAARKKAAEAQNRVDECKKVINTLQITGTALKKSIETLDQPVCPLSEKLRCTTDKSTIKKELTDAYAAAESSYKEQQFNLKKLLSQVESFQNEIVRLEAEREKEAKKELIKSRLEQGLKQLTVVPKVPAQPKEQINAEDSQELIKELKNCEEYEKLTEYRKKLMAAKKKAEELNSLVVATAPKGQVRERIITEYLSDFEAVCTETANRLRKGMAVSLRYEDGVVAMLDAKGDSTFLPYESLSGGEKLLMIVILLDMLCTMSGFKIMFLDELSVLDKNNFSSLINVLTSDVVKTYDQIFLTTVNHEIFEEELRKYGITKIPG